MEEYQQSHFSPPEAQPSQEEKLARNLSKSIETLKDSFTAETLMSVAQKQGEEFGRFTKTVTDEANKWRNEAITKECELKKMEEELKSKEKAIGNVSLELEKKKSDLEKTEQQELEARSLAEEMKAKFTPRNVQRRELTKNKKIDQLKEKHKSTVKSLKEQLAEKDREIANAQSLASVMRQQLREQEKEKEDLKKAKRNEQKRASKYKMKIENVQKSVKESSKSQLQKIDYLENENEELREKFLKSTQVVSWENGRYTDEVRSTYMELLANGVSITKCDGIISTVLSNLAGKTADRLPGKSMASQLRAEAAVLAKI